MSHPAPESGSFGRTPPEADELPANPLDTQESSWPTTDSTTREPATLSADAAVESPPPFGGDDIDSASDDRSAKADAAKEQGRQVKDEAVEGGKHVAGVATEQAQSVVSEATGQAKDLLGQAQSQLAEQAATQQQSITGWLRSLADELHELVDRGSSHDDTGGGAALSAGEPGSGTDSNGVAAKAITQAHGRINGAADWLDQREPRELLDEATRFARQRPGAFLAIAAAGGLLVGRFARGLKDDSSTDTPAAQAGESEPVGTASTPPAPTAGESFEGRPGDVDAVTPTLSPSSSSSSSSSSARWGSGELSGREPR